MKKIYNFSLFSLLIIFAAVIFVACEKETIIPERDSNLTPRTYEIVKGEGFDRSNLNTIERVMIALSKSLSNIVKNENSVDSKTLKEFILRFEKRRVLAGDFNSMTLKGQPFLELLVENLDPVDADISSVVSDICRSYPHISIGLPLWTAHMPDERIVNVDFVVFPGVRRMEENTWRGILLENGTFIDQNKKGHLSQIPLQVKEVEDLIPYRETDQTTFLGDHIKDHFPHINFCPDQVKELSRFSTNFTCNSEFKLLNLVEFRDHLRKNCFVQNENCDNGIDDDGDGLIDDEDPDCNGFTSVTDEICDNGIDDDGDGLIDGDDDDCECEPNCDRDCVLEKNVFEGFVVSGNARAAFLKFSNTPGGEDNFTFHFDFVFSGMCGDFSQSSTTCEAQSVPRKVFTGTPDEFFEFQTIEGFPTNAEEQDLLAIFYDPIGDEWWYTKIFAKYYDLPVTNDPEGLYTQFQYLNNEENWDGDLFGDLVTWGIHEHDNVLVSTQTQKQTMVNNTARVSLNLVPVSSGGTAGTGTNGGGSGAGSSSSAAFSFSNSIVRTSSLAINITAEQDTPLGNGSSNYCDKNFTNADIGFGRWAPSGTISVHLAYYY